MAETLRELIVSLSLNSENFSQNIKAINAQIKQVDSEFKLAGAGVDKFAGSLAGQLAKVQMLTQKQQLQGLAVQQYTARLADANAKLQAAEANYNKYSTRLSEARGQLTSLNAAIEQQNQKVLSAQAVLASEDAAYQQNISTIGSLTQTITMLEQEIAACEMMYQHSFDTLGAGDAQTEQYRIRLDTLNSALQKEKATLQSVQAQTQNLSRAREFAASTLQRETQRAQQLTAQKALLEAEIKKLEGQVQQETRAFNNNRTAVVRAQTELNNARAKLRELDAELKVAEDELRIMSSAWTKAGKALAEFSTKLETTGKAMSRTGRMMTMYITTPIIALGKKAYSASADFESSMATVRKTLGLTGDTAEETYSRLATAAKQMSEVVGRSASDVADVMATGAQLGIAADNLETFTRMVIDLSNTAVNLNADEAATSIARFANIMGSSKNYDDMNDTFQRIGSTIVMLGNNFATTEGEIIEMSERIAGAGAQVGLTEYQVLALATAMSSLGLQAQAGGTAVSKALIKMESAVEATDEASQKALADFATITGLTTEQFQALWRNNPMAAFQMFINGMAELDEAGYSAILTLQDLGWNEIRLRDAMMRVTNGNEILINSANMASAAWDENSALATKSAERYGTTSHKVAQLKQQMNNLAITVGDDLRPTILKVVEAISGLIERFQSLDEGTRLNIEKWAAIVAAVGPAMFIFGKLSTVLGKITGVISKVSLAIGSKGLLGALKSSPSAMIALTAAIGYGVYALYDYASGAKAAREAIESLNSSAQRWRDNQADTFYSSSNGLGAFGMDQGEFTRAAKTVKWFTALLTEWSDNEVETAETVNKYVDSFKNATETTRQALNTLATGAAENGMSELYHQIMGDMSELDEIDAEIESLLRQKQEYFLDDEDQKRLNELIEKRTAMELKYHTGTNETSSFEQLNTEIDAAVERAKTVAAEGGADISSSIYQDAMVAAAQGMKAINKEIDAEYSERYRLVSLIADASERENALTELNAWYMQQRNTYAQEYLNTLKKVSPEIAKSDNIEKTSESLTDLFNALKTYQQSGDTGGANLSKLVEGLDENAIAEYYAYFTQLYSLLDQGFSETDIAAMAGLDPQTLTNVFTQLEQIRNLVGSMDKDDVTAPIIEMFSTSLPEEIIKIATDLDMTGAEAAWKEFAANPGSKVFTDALLQSYSDEGADTSTLQIHNLDGTMTTVTANPTSYDLNGLKITVNNGTMTAVEPDSDHYDLSGEVDIDAGEGTMNGVVPNPEGYEVAGADIDAGKGEMSDVVPKPDGYEVTSASIDAGTGTMSFVTDKGSIYYVTTAKIKAGSGEMTAVKPNGETYPVKGAIIDAGDGKMSVVLPNGDTYDVVGADINAGKGEMSFVTDNGTTYLVENADIDAGEGTVTDVKPREEPYVLTGATVSATGEVTQIDPLSETVIRTWRAAQGNKVPVLGKVELGDDWVTELEEQARQGNVVLYDEDGLEINIKPGVKPEDLIDARSLVLGVDENDVYHVSVRTHLAEEDPEKIAKDIEEKYGRGGEGGSGYGVINNAFTRAIAQAKNGQLRDKVYSKVGNNIFGDALVGFGEWLFGGSVGKLLMNAPNPDEVKEYSEAVASLVNAVTKEGKTATFGNDEIVFLTDMADVIDGLTSSGYPALANKLVSDLEQIGVSVKASELPDYLREVATSMVDFANFTDVDHISDWTDSLTQMSDAMSLVMRDYRQGRITKDEFLESYAKYSGIMTEDSLDYINGLESKVKEAVAALEASGEEVPEAYKNFLLFKQLFDAVKPDFDTLGSLLTVPEPAYDVPNDTKAVIEEGITESTYAAIGLNIPLGLASGILSGQSSVVDAIVSVAQAAVAAAQEALKIESPSKVFKNEVGAMVMKGFGEGIIDETAHQAAIMRNAAKYITDEAQAGSRAAMNSQVNTYTYNTDASLSFDGANFNVRSEDDVTALAREIAALTKRYQRGKGTK